MNTQNTEVGSDHYTAQIGYNTSEIRLILRNNGLPHPTIGKIDMDGDLRENWYLFKLSWTNYADATRIDTQPAKVQVGTFLSIVDKECLKIILKNLPMRQEERADINSIIKKLSDYFEPKLNTTYERYVFNSCDQEIGERFDSYLNKGKLIKTCRYSMLKDELLRDRIVMGTNKKEIRTRLLRQTS